MRISDWSSDVCSSDLAWPCSGDAGPVELPAGTTLVVPEDPTYETGLDRLVQRLAAAGFEQFVVPDDLAPAIALILAQSTAELGFVLGHEALTGDVAATLAYLPTAVFMPTNESVAARLLLYCRQWRSEEHTSELQSLMRNSSAVFCL